jgi:hypothetical protein
MDIQAIVSNLKDERSRIDQAITALEGLTATPRRGRPPKATSPGGRRRRMSPAARKRISEAMKQRQDGRESPRRSKSKPRLRRPPFAVR